MRALVTELERIPSRPRTSLAFSVRRELANVVSGYPGEFAEQTLEGRTGIESEPRSPFTTSLAPAS